MKKLVKKQTTMKNMKVDYTQEFEARGIPLEASQADAGAKELKMLGNFFNMDESVVHDMRRKTVNDGFFNLKASSLQQDDDVQDEMTATCEAFFSLTTLQEQAEPTKVPHPMPIDDAHSAWSLDHSKSPQLPSVETTQKEWSEAKRRLHRPLTVREWKEATHPVPIAINDFPSIFEKDLGSRGGPQETHYDYFMRRLPTENPEYRMARRYLTENVRKNFKYHGRRNGVDNFDGSLTARW
mmetsp:Transcript_69299/g.122667  ORF Transcript_69299/g.122667 Transcript_69299/m.122667 type:complete len:239 (+) Transcript_69299:96-812(+)